MSSSSHLVENGSGSVGGDQSPSSTTSHSSNTPVILHRRTPSQPNMSSLSGSYGSLNSQFPPLPNSLPLSSSSRPTIKSQQLTMAQQILQHQQQQQQQQQQQLQQQQQQQQQQTTFISSSVNSSPTSNSPIANLTSSTASTNTTSNNNNTPPARKKYKPMQRFNSYDNDQTVCYGWLVILCTLIFFIFTTYCLVISKFLPDTGNRILDFIKYDWYYCLLLPVLVPVTIITVYLNWLSLKFFRHN
ncbi:transmembrane protein [Heterostelium album PN500]|uniref:Transmembrane protein n=1 Tax=Heterostelium pallidum (strain ATCC 26659 / Pp 5 / PN500) TaxID=670386 RepID=D3BNN2_HETP5|nr:transmembrane protein [Heterostelium album PN500]EFA76983.1 transmembrane protein [Heterostelium album PN500]|eukprot:XP_020429114.1 transmembrane protein [Heterostelium album PN500]